MSDDYGGLNHGANRKILHLLTIRTAITDSHYQNMIYYIYSNLM